MKLWIPLACLGMVLMAGSALWTDRADGLERAASPHTSHRHAGEDRSPVDRRPVASQERGPSLIPAEGATTRQTVAAERIDPAQLPSREAWFVEAERWQRDLAEALRQGDSANLDKFLSNQLPTEKE